MLRVVNLPSQELNGLLTCQLCSGYLIDATSIVECLHAFCRSCIVKYLNSHNTCPVCGVLLHKTKPHVAIHSDKALQTIVYKLIPGLFDKEMERRKLFYQDKPEGECPLSPEKRGDLSFKAYVFQEDDRFSLELEYYPPSNSPHLKRDATTYLLCPAGLTVGSLLKFLRSKLDIGPHSDYQVVLFCSNDCLSPEYTLLDLAYIYSWRRQKPMKIYYTVVNNLEQSSKNSSQNAPLPSLISPKISDLLANSTLTNTKFHNKDGCNDKLPLTTNGYFSSKDKQCELFKSSIDIPCSNNDKNSKSNLLCDAVGTYNNGISKSNKDLPYIHKNGIVSSNGH